MVYFMGQILQIFNKKRTACCSRPFVFGDLFNRCRLTEVFLLHRHASAAATYKFHGGQFVFALMGVIRFGGTTEAAFGLIAARIAKMPGCIGDRTAVFTCIGHNLSP
jgi:hypothetical protein